MGEGRCFFGGGGIRCRTALAVLCFIQFHPSTGREPTKKLRESSRISSFLLITVRRVGFILFLGGSLDGGIFGQNASPILDLFLADAKNLCCGSVPKFSALADAFLVLPNLLAVRNFRA